MDLLTALSRLGGVSIRLDRIIRSTSNFVHVLEELDHFGVGLICTDQSVDTPTQMGKFLRTILMVVAEFERETARDRTLDRLAKARADGKQLGRPVVEIDTDEAVKLLEEGISKVKDAEMLGTNPATLRNRLWDAGREDLVESKIRRRN